MMKARGAMTTTDAAALVTDEIVETAARAFVGPFLGRGVKQDYRPPTDIELEAARAALLAVAPALYDALTARIAELESAQKTGQTINPRK